LKPPLDRIEWGRKGVDTLSGTLVKTSSVKIPTQRPRPKTSPDLSSANSSKEQTLEEHCWDGLKSIFIRRMEFNRVIDCLELIPEMERIAGLIGFDLIASKESADKDLPPPKSWGEVDPHTLEAA